MISKEIKKRPIKSSEEKVLNERFLVLHNDNVHSFDYVIDALMDICGHAYEQAAQCTIITHYKGKCEIKKGIFETLKHIKEMLLERKLNVTIN